MKVIYYGTDKFDTYVKNKSKVSLMKAWNLAKKYRKKKYGYEGGGGILFIVNDNYVFPRYRRLKLGDASLMGIWVDTQTGETKFVESKEMLVPQVEHGWKGD